MEENKTYQSGVIASFNEEAFLRALEKCQHYFEQFAERKLYSKYDCSQAVLFFLLWKVDYERKYKSSFVLELHYNKEEDLRFIDSPNYDFYFKYSEEQISFIFHTFSNFYFGDEDCRITTQVADILFGFMKISYFQRFFSPEFLGSFIFDIFRPTIQNNRVFDPFNEYGSLIGEGIKKYSNDIEITAFNDLTYAYEFSKIRAKYYSSDLDKLHLYFARFVNNFGRVTNKSQKSLQGESEIVFNNYFDFIVTDPKLELEILGDEKFNFPTKITFKISTLAIIEKLLNCLKENGQLAIILPDDVLLPNSKQKDGIYTDMYAEARKFFEAQAEINLIVSLPETTYYSLGSTHKRSIVFFTKKQYPKPYKVYLAANKFGSKGVHEKEIVTFLDEIVLKYKQKTLPSINSEDLTSWSADRLLAFKNDLFKNDLPKIKLRDVILSINKEKIKRHENSLYNKISIKQNNRIELTEVEFLYEERTSHSFFAVKNGQLIISSLNLHNGGIAVFDDEFGDKKIKNAIISDKFYVLDINTNIILGEYLVALFNQKLMKEYIYRISNGSSRISVLTLLEIEVPKLSLTEQQKFVDNALKIKTLEQENKVAINQLFNSK